MNSTKYSHLERRRATRLTAARRPCLVAHTQGVYDTAEIIDVSNSGICVRFHGEQPPDERMAFSCFVAGEVLRRRLRVKWSRTEGGKVTSGAEFIHPASSDPLFEQFMAAIHPQKKHL